MFRRGFFARGSRYATAGSDHAPLHHRSDALRRALRPSAIETLTEIDQNQQHVTPGQGPSSFSHVKDELMPQLLKDQRPKIQRPLSLHARARIARDVDKTYLEVTEDWFGQRLDEFVSHHYPNLSYGRLKRLIENGDIYRHRRDTLIPLISRVTARLQLGERIVVPHDLAQRLSQPKSELDDISADSVTEEDRDSKYQTNNSVPLPGRAREEALNWVLFKNQHIIVINKPYGIPTSNPKSNSGRSTSLGYSRPRSATSTSSADLTIESLLPAWRYTQRKNPFICNFLDAETSGIVVLARSPNAHRLLAKMFMRRSVPLSSFWAVLAGAPVCHYGRIKMHLERPGLNKHGRPIHKEGSTDHGSTTSYSPAEIIARPTPTKHSVVAQAEYTINATLNNYACFASFYPLTTRKDELRVMAAHALRSPILGDTRFGGDAAVPTRLNTLWRPPNTANSSQTRVDPSDDPPPLYLHHRKIQLPYKNSDGSYITVTAPMPEHMNSFFKRVGWPVNVDDAMIPG